ncbi:MAG TPA: Hsp33 family molecular chaperone HslO [Candidatus Eremiobacteraceae bacterium]|nr:Hsp33 family molecular chaperone HslO [Candidatus Eremiobacteraceae bacterium]
MDVDYAAIALAGADTVRVVGARTTSIVREAQSRHGCSPTVTAALGRLLTGAALMGSTLAGRERITLQVAGDGPARGLIAEIAAGGRLRGYPLRPSVDRPLNARGKFDVGGVVGRGFLHVTRTFDTGQPYTSAVPLASGEIGEDLAQYFARSEQIPTVIAVGVLANPSGVLAAGGVFAQVLPGASERVIDSLEAAARALPQVSALVRDGDTPEQLVGRLAAALHPRIAGTQALAFDCHCDRTRVVKALVGLGRSALAAIVDAGEETEATCDFCRRKYYFAADEIRAILRDAQADCA